MTKDTLTQLRREEKASSHLTGSLKGEQHTPPRSLLHGALYAVRTLTDRRYIMAYVVRPPTDDDLKLFLTFGVPIPKGLGNPFFLDASSKGDVFQPLAVSCDEHGLGDHSPDANFPGDDPYNQLAYRAILNSLYGQELTDDLPKTIVSLIERYAEYQKYGQALNPHEVEQTMDLLESTHPKMLRRARRHQISPVHITAMYRRAMAKAVMRRRGEPLEKLHEVTNSNDVINATLKYFQGYLAIVATIEDPIELRKHAEFSFFSPLITYETGLFWINDTNAQIEQQAKIAEAVKAHLTEVREAPPIPEFQPVEQAAAVDLEAVRKALLDTPTSPRSHSPLVSLSSLATSPGPSREGSEVATAAADMKKPAK